MILRELNFEIEKVINLLVDEDLLDEAQALADLRSEYSKYLERNRSLKELRSEDYEDHISSMTKKVEAGLKQIKINPDRSRAIASMSSEITFERQVYKELKNEKKTQAKRNKKLKKLGIKDPSHNVLMNCDFVFDILPNVNKDDLCFICNHIGKLHNFHKDNYVGDFRLAKKGNRKQWKKFKEARTCCGSDEIEITNEKTGNTFIIGCNYGH